VATAKSDLLISINANDKASAALTGINGKIQGMSKQLRMAGMGMVAVGGIVTGVLGKSITDFAKAGDEVHKMALRTGFATETLSELKYAAAIGGGSLQDIEKAVKKMAKTIVDADDGMTEYIRGFDRIGLKAEELMELSPEEQFEKIAFAIASIENPTIRAATAQDIFGRAGTALLPMLADGKEGLEAVKQKAHELGLVFDKEAAEKAMLFTDAMTNLKGSMDGTKHMLAETLMPTITNLVEKVTEIIGKIKDWKEDNERLFAWIVKVTAVSGLLLIPLGTFLIMLPLLSSGIVTMAGGMRAMAVATWAARGALLKWMAIAVAAASAGLLLGWAVWNIQRAFEGKSILTFTEYMAALGRDMKRWSDALLDGIGGLEDLTGATSDLDAEIARLGLEVDALTDDKLPDLGKAGEAAYKDWERAVRGVNKQLTLQERLLHNLRSVVGVGSGRAEELMKSQRGAYDSEGKFMEALRMRGKVWTGTGWLPAEVAGRYGRSPLPFVPLPHEAGGISPLEYQAKYYAEGPAKEWAKGQLKTEVHVYLGDREVSDLVVEQIEEKVGLQGG